MKRSLIAMAVAGVVAAPSVLMADVTVYGNARYELANTNQGQEGTNPRATVTPATVNAAGVVTNAVLTPGPEHDNSNVNGRMRFGSD